MIYLFIVKVFLTYSLCFFYLSLGRFLSLFDKTVCGDYKCFFVFVPKCKQSVCHTLSSFVAYN